MADRNSYNSIFKALALFGGVRVFQILINILRAKIIAILIGPAGMGINNLLKSTLDTVNHLTGCGLNTSAVRDVAKAHSQDNQDRINIVMSTLRVIVWFTGIIATLIVFFASGWLSEFAFGNKEFTSAFKLLSIIMLVTQLNTGQIALLQGTFHYKDLAKCSLWGNLLSLIFTVPLYYFFREGGIVPSLIIASFITMFFSWYSAKKVKFTFLKLPLKEFWHEGKSMLSLGAVLAIGSIVGNLSTYILSIYLSNRGSLDIVGYYTAGTTIANSYIFLVMSAMSTDYVPRLSALSDTPKEQVKAINKQIELLIVILFPLLIFLIIFSKQVIQLLYTSEFIVITEMLQLFMVGMVFQAITWCLSYVLVANGHSRLFFLTEIYNCIISVSFKILGYHFGGLTGIGIAFIVDYVFELLLVWYVCKMKIGFKINSECRKIILCVILVISLICAIMFQPIALLSYTIGLIALIFSIIYSYIELNKRVGLNDILNKFIKNQK